jgi:hypothetical protein
VFWPTDWATSVPSELCATTGSPIDGSTAGSPAPLPLEDEPFEQPTSEATRTTIIAEVTDRTRTAVCIEPTYLATTPAPEAGAPEVPYWGTPGGAMADAVGVGSLLELPTKLVTRDRARATVSSVSGARWGMGVCSRVGLSAVVVLGGLVGCGGDDGNAKAEAFCSDLAAGLTPFQILAGEFDDPAVAADRAYAWAAIECPDELRSNESLRTYLDNWDIDPDA